MCKGCNIYTDIYLDLVIQYKQNRMYLLYRKQRNQNTSKTCSVSSWNSQVQSKNYCTVTKRNQSFQSKVRTNRDLFCSMPHLLSMQHYNCSNAKSITRFAATVRYNVVRKASSNLSCPQWREAYRSTIYSIAEISAINNPYWIVTAELQEVMQTTDKALPSTFSFQRFIGLHRNCSVTSIYLSCLYLVMKM